MYVCEPLHKTRVRSWHCKIDLSTSSSVIYITDRSRAILLLWFYLLYVLESIFVLFESYVRFHSFSHG